MILRENCSTNIFIHLCRCMQWLSLAQNASNDQGVSQSYFLKKIRWSPSYPETTGYIIPTFFSYSKFTNDIYYYDKSISMSDWACQVQMQCGAIQAGTIDDNPPRPTIFNTGQVLFGWASAFRESNDEKYYQSLIKASDWLCSAQDDDGAWRRFGSTKTKHTLNTYNTRTAWGLIEAYKVSGIEAYKKAAVKNIEWALTQQLPNGWFENNCLQDIERPFTHTIAYAMRGFLEVGDALQEDRYINAAYLAAKALLRKQKRNGSWAGQFNRKWRRQCRWSCLTGNSQLAICFIRLYEITGEQKFFSAAQKANRFNMSVQDTQTDDPNIRGGIPGSWPIDGGYHPYQYPNWAAKFIADALMAELKHLPEKQ